MPLRVIVVDDEPLGRQAIAGLLADDPNVTVVAECATGEEAVLAIGEHQPDLVFLDIRMPRLDGFGVVETVGPDAMPEVVFVTAHDEHAVRAFEVHALDYLLKPVSRERLLEAVARARQRSATTAIDELRRRLDALVADLDPPGPRYLERVPVTDGHGVRLVPVDDICRIEAADVYVRLHLEADAVLARTSLDRLARQLDPARFVRVHRSHLARIDLVRQLRPRSSGSWQVRLANGTWLPVGPTFRSRLRQLFGDRPWADSRPSNNMPRG
jgi:two-component system, LytTR family, response regulator